MLLIVNPRWAHAGYYVNKSNDEGEKLKGAWGICPKMDVLQFSWTGRLGKVLQFSWPEGVVNMSLALLALR